MPRVDAIIVAGGSGIRLGADHPKAFVEVAGKPMFLHSVEVFVSLEGINQIVVVVPVGYEGEARRLTADYIDAKDLERLAFVRGGESRADSVLFGLRALNDMGHLDASNSWVAVHDAARPMVSSSLLNVMLDVAFELSKLDNHELQSGAGIVPAIPVVDTLRTVTALEDPLLPGGFKGGATVQRQNLRAVQTPQLLSGEILMKTLEEMSNELRSRCTDCASAIQSAGGEVLMVDGDTTNFKVTDQKDLLVADLMLRQRLSGVEG